MTPGLTVAVCTYLRPQAISRLLDSLVEQVDDIDALVVVDASPDDLTEKAVSAHRLAAAVPTTYVRVEEGRRGTPRQRNRAVEEVATDLVLFLDDDVTVEPGCLRLLAGRLHEDASLAGTGAAVVTDVLPPPAAGRWLWRARQALGVVPDLTPGRYHRTGFSTNWEPRTLLTDGARGDWLPGCAMAWRTDLARKLRFADDFAGYAQGEDLEFSLRAGRHGALEVVAGAAVRDHHDPAGRPDVWWRAYAELRNRAEIHRRGLAGRTRADAARFAYAWAVDTVLVVVAALARGRAGFAARVAGGRAAAAADLVRRRPMGWREARRARRDVDLAALSVCVVTSTPAWRDPATGSAASIGGFPLQMTALAARFRSMLLLQAGSEPLPGGMPLPSGAEVVLIRPPRGRDLTRKLFLVATLPRYLVAIDRAVRRADAVHVPLPGDLPALALAIAVARRKPVVARWCASWDDNSQTTPANRAVKAALRRLAGRPRTVVLATGDGAEPPAPGVTWIGSTTLSAAELEEATADLARPRSTPFALTYVGRLSPEKGVDVLLDALPLLLARGRAVALTCLGDGPARPALEAQVADLDLGDVVTFRGRVDRPELLAELATADLCVQPSRTEGFSKAWLDALSCGVPLVASAGAAASSLVDASDAGWTVPAEDPAALAAAIEAAIDEDDEAYAARRRRGRWAVKGRTLEAWAAEIADRCRVAWSR